MLDSSAKCLCAFAFACMTFQTAIATDTIVLQGCLVSASEEIDLPARRAGVLQSISAKPGDEFVANDPLGQIDAEDAKRRVADAQSRAHEAKLTAASDTRRIEAANLTAGVAEYELREMQEIEKKAAAAISPIEIAKAELSAQRARLEETLAKETQTLNQAIHQRELVSVAQAEADLAATKLIAPIDGVVVKHHKDVGEWVEAGEPVLRIVRLDTVRIEGFVRERDLRQLRRNPQQLLGAEVSVTIDLPDGGKANISHAKIKYVSPLIEPNGNCHLWAEVDNLRVPLENETKSEKSAEISADGPRTGWLLAPGMSAEMKFAPLKNVREPKSWDFSAQRESR